MLRHLFATSTAPLIRPRQVLASLSRPQSLTLEALPATEPKMRTRSDAARQRSLLKLPEDCLRNVALFIDCDVDAARLALTSKRVMRSMTPMVWAQILKASHGGLKIAAADLDDGLRVAARLAAARANGGHTVRFGQGIGEHVARWGLPL